MKFSGKCFAVAISALFAFTPVVPVNAMPLSASNVQTTGGQADIQLVRNNDWASGRRVWKERRGGHRQWRSDRRSNRHWRGDRGSRHGWYRGHRGYRYARPGYRNHNGYWFPLAAFGAGAIIGGAVANDRSYSGGSSHVNWCANRYRSYRAYDNTYQPYGGPRRQCMSPYR